MESDSVEPFGIEFFPSAQFPLGCIQVAACITRLFLFIGDEHSILKIVDPVLDQNVG